MRFASLAMLAFLLASPSWSSDLQYKVSEPYLQEKGIQGFLFDGFEPKLLVRLVASSGDETGLIIETTSTVLSVTYSERDSKIFVSWDVADGEITFVDRLGSTHVRKFDFEKREWSSSTIDSLAFDEYSVELRTIGAVVADLVSQKALSMPRLTSGFSRSKSRKLLVAAPTGAFGGPVFQPPPGGGGGGVQSCTGYEVRGTGGAASRSL